MFAIAGIVSAGLWRWLKWFRELNPPPDPWEGKLDEPTDAEDAVPLCCACMAAHQSDDQFCPNCGNPVGPCTTLHPLPSMLASGQLFRTGTSGRFHSTWFTVAGFLIVSLGLFTFYIPILGLFPLVPLYWFMMIENARRNREADRDAAARLQSPPDTVSPAS